MKAYNPNWLPKYASALNLVNPVCNNYGAKLVYVTLLYNRHITDCLTIFTK